MSHSLAFSSLGRVSVNDYNAKMKTRIACNNSSGRYAICSQVTQPFSKFEYLFQSLKTSKYVIQIIYKKSLERIPSLAYTEIK